MLLLSLCAVSCSRSESSGDLDNLTLEVDADNWPLRVLELGQDTIRLVAERGETAYLTKISISLPDVNQTSGTSVSYEFYSPLKRNQLVVSYLNTDLSVSAEQMESARLAGVDQIMRDAQAAALAPQFNEYPMREGAYVPTPLPGAQLGLRDAWELARQEGMVRADRISLWISEKDPALPLLMWTFNGEHTRSDSQQINISAVSGEYIDEDRINALSRAERAAQLEEGLDSIRAFLRSGQRSRGSEWSSELTPAAAEVVNDGNDNTEHGYYFDGLHDYTLEPAADCAARGGYDGGAASFGGNYCY